MNKELANNYRNKVGSFIKTMVAKPSVVDDEYVTNRELTLKEMSTTRKGLGAAALSPMMQMNRTSGFSTISGHPAFDDSQSMNMSFQVGNRNNNLSRKRNETLQNIQNYQTNSTQRDQFQGDVGFLTGGFSIGKPDMTQQAITIHTYADPAKRTNKGFRFASN